MGSGRGLPHLSGDAYASEDDRPEEVSLEAAKSDLQKKKSEEQAAQRRQATQAKEARRRQSQKKAEDGPSELLTVAAKSSRKEKTRKRKSDPIDEHATQPQAEETQPSSVPGVESEELLPPGVLEELAKKERLDMLKRVAARQETTARPRPRTKKKQGVSSAAKEKSSGIQIVVLGPDKPLAKPFTEGAAHFREERFFGPNKRRSQSMLPSVETSFV